MPITSFKAILPKRVNQEKAIAEILRAMESFGEDPQKDLEATVQTWQGDKPRFRKKLRIGGDVVLRIEAVGNVEGLQKWFWADRGTKPHLIAPKGPYPLRFREGYQAKTRPGVFPSGSGGAYGDEVRARSVRHPGTKPRGWTEMIVEKYRPKFWDAVRRGLERAAKASGHGG